MTSLKTESPAAGVKKPRKRWVRVLTWIAIVLAAILAVGGVLAWWFVLPETPSEPELATTVTEETITVDGVERHYVTVVPDDLPAHAPLWVVLHGSNNTVEQIRSFTGYELERLAAEKGFVVVYGEGYEKTWHDCRTATPYPARTDGIDDVKVVNEMVSATAGEYDLDTSRVYGFGYSNGAHMLYRMAAESPGTFSGIVMNAANAPADPNNECAALTTALPVMLVEGTDDPINPYEGGEAGAFGQKLGLVQSSAASAERFAEVGGLGLEPAESLAAGAEGADGSVTLAEYGAGTAAPVRLYSVIGGGHTIPAAGVRYPRIMGGSTTEFSSPVTAVEFFENLPSAAAE